MCILIPMKTYLSYLMSISFTAACTIGNLTSLGPLPTNTNTPPGFVE